MVLLCIGYYILYDGNSAVDTPSQMSRVDIIIIIHATKRYIWYSNWHHVLRCRLKRVYKIIYYIYVIWFSYIILFGPRILVILLSFDSLSTYIYRNIYNIYIMYIVPFSTYLYIYVDFRPAFSSTCRAYNVFWRDFWVRNSSCGIKK